jgi:hypothetical protein
MQTEQGLKNFKKERARFVKAFGRAEFDERYKAWQQKANVTVGWQSLPDDALTHLQNAIEQSDRWGRGKRVATETLPVGEWDG